MIPSRTRTMTNQTTTQTEQEDTTMQDAAQTQPAKGSNDNTKDKPVDDNTINNKRKKTPKKSHHPPPSTQTLHPTYTYLHLSLIRTPPTTYPTNTNTNTINDTTATAALDLPTVRGHLLLALSQYLGDHGAAIPVDILHLQKQDVHVRVPVQDGSAVVAALAGWIGHGGVAWRVKGRGEWLSGLVGECGGGGDGGQGLFEFAR